MALPSRRRSTGAIPAALRRKLGISSEADYDKAARTISDARRRKPRVMKQTSKRLEEALEKQQKQAAATAEREAEAFSTSQSSAGSQVGFDPAHSEQCQATGSRDEVCSSGLTAGTGVHADAACSLNPQVHGSNNHSEPFTTSATKQEHSQ